MEYRNKTIAFFFLFYCSWGMEMIQFGPQNFYFLSLCFQGDIQNHFFKKKNQKGMVICCFNYYNVKLRHTMDCYSTPRSCSFFLSLNSYPFQSLNILFFQFCPPMLYSHGFKPNNLFRFVYYVEFTVSKNVLALL